MVPAAEITSHWMLNADKNLGISAGNVLAIKFVKVNAKTNSFQDIIMAKIAVAAIPDLAIGSTTLLNAWSLVIPSIMAASSYSIGMPSKMPFIIHTVNERLRIIYTKINPILVSISAAFVKMR